MGKTNYYGRAVDLDCPAWIERQCRIKAYAESLAEAHGQSRAEERKEILTLSGVLGGFLAVLAMICCVVL